MRLDLYLSKTQKITRARAQHLIDNSFVEVNGKIVTKASFNVDDGYDIKLLDNLKFSSIGGDKLQKAFNDFSYSVKDKICADIGASNGGFTDCMLKNGAVKVYAVDVGECAFGDDLKNDPRVIIKDRTNARYLKVEDLGESVDFVSVDVSFISLRLILSSVYGILKPGGETIALIKPQFEAGSKFLSKSGIVLSEKVRTSICDDVKKFAIELGFIFKDITVAPIKVNKNKEYLIFLYKPIE